MNGNNPEQERLEEFKTAFSSLDDSAKEIAVSILRALEFAQSAAISAAADISKLNMGAVAV